MSLKDQKDYEKALRDIALENGIKQGIKQGIEKGIEQGEDKKEREMIKSMYSKKVSIKNIASIANISISKVKNILGLY